MGAKVEIQPAVSGWFWRVVAANGEVLCHSQVYTRKRDAKRGAKTLLETVRLVEKVTSP